MKTSHIASVGHVERYIGTAYDKVKLVADNIEKVTDVADWLVDEGIAVGITIDSLEATQDFIPGVTTQLLLSKEATVKEEIDIFFDGVYQHKSEFSFTKPYTINFTEVVPLDVGSIELRYKYVKDS